MMNRVVFLTLSTCLVLTGAAVIIAASDDSPLKRRWAENLIWKYGRVQLPEGAQEIRTQISPGLWSESCRIEMAAPSAVLRCWEAALRTQSEVQKREATFEMRTECGLVLVSFPDRQHALIEAATD